MLMRLNGGNFHVTDFDEKADNIKEILKGKSELTDSEAASAYEHIKTKFKKQAPSNLKKTFKYVPPRLKEVYFCTILIFFFFFHNYR